MVKRMIVAAVAIFATALSTQAAEWKLDKPHSSCEFKVSHMVISNVVGQFNDFDANLQFDGTDLAAGSVEANITVGSINTENERRDNHLKSPDFLDAVEHPTITFKSKTIIPGEGKKFKMVGDLTIRGVTKEVTLDCEFHGTIDAMGTTKAGFSAQTKINRQDYGVSWSKTLDNGGLVAGNDVTITLELEFDKEA